MRLFPTVPLAIKIFILTLSLYVGIFLLVFLTGINKTIMPSEDVITSTYLPVSLVLEHDFDLDEFAPFFLFKYPNPDNKTGIPFYLRIIQDHYVSGFPVIAPLMAVPIYLIPTLLFQPSAESYLIPILAKISASVIVSLSVVMMFNIAKIFLRERKALLLSLVYGLGTSTFALSSQGMWQHGPVGLLLLSALYFLLTNTFSSRNYFLSGLFFSLATLTRPSVFIVAGLFAIYILLKQRQLLIYFILGALLPLLPWFWYNQIYFGSIWQHAYTTGVGTEGNWTGKFPEGFLGLWLSPSKGILIYSPVLLLGVIGGIRVLRDNTLMRELNLLWRFLALSVVAYTLLMGKWYHWFGGWSFSYRMALDVIPYLVLLMIPVFLTDWSKVLKRVFMGLFALSFAVQIVGVIFFDGEWHARFDKGPDDTRWLWSVNNSELVYYGRKTFCKVSSRRVDEYMKCQGFEY